METSCMKVAGVAAIDVIGMNVSLLESPGLQRGSNDTVCVLVGTTQSQTLSNKSSHSGNR